MLDSLVVEEAITGPEQKNNQADLWPTLEEVVAQIKATPPNPQQIQRATKTIDQVRADWGANLVGCAPGDEAKRSKPRTSNRLDGI